MAAAGRIAAAGIDGKRAEHLSGADEAHHQMLAARTGLDDLHPPIDERIAGERFVALGEDARALLDPAGAGVAEHVDQHLTVEAAEQAHLGDHIGVELRRHGRISALSSASLLRIKEPRTATAYVPFKTKRKT
jgi:hypothetical protein